MKDSEIWKRDNPKAYKELVKVHGFTNEPNQFDRDFDHAFVGEFGDEFEFVRTELKASEEIDCNDFPHYCLDLEQLWQVYQDDGYFYIVDSGLFVFKSW